MSHSILGLQICGFEKQGKWTKRNILYKEVDVNDNNRASHHG